MFGIKVVCLVVFQGFHSIRIQTQIIKSVVLASVKDVVVMVAELVPVSINNMTWQQCVLSPPYQASRENNMYNYVCSVYVLVFVCSLSNVALVVNETWLPFLLLCVNNQHKEKVASHSHTKLL